MGMRPAGALLPLPCRRGGIGKSARSRQRGPVSPLRPAAQPTRRPARPTGHLAPATGASVDTSPTLTLGPTAPGRNPPPGPPQPLRRPAVPRHRRPLRRPRLPQRRRDHRQRPPPPHAPSPTAPCAAPSASSRTPASWPPGEPTASPPSTSSRPWTTLCNAVHTPASHDRGPRTTASGDPGHHCPGPKRCCLQSLQKW